MGTTGESPGRDSFELYLIIGQRTGKRINVSEEGVTGGVGATARRSGVLDHGEIRKRRSKAAASGGRKVRHPVDFCYAIGRFSWCSLCGSFLRD